MNMWFSEYMYMFEAVLHIEVAVMGTELKMVCASE